MVAAARYFEYYGGAADKVHGDTIPFLPGYFVTTERVAHGVVGHIIPWNYPAQMFCRTAAPALAMGNASVIKPAEDACLTPLRLAELAAGVGFPEGAINIVPGLGEEAGAALANHPGLDFISFTGSPEVGTLIQTAAARNHIGCVMELGGKSPHVVFGDADLDTAIPVIATTLVQNAGQTCSAGSRLLVERAAYDRVVERLAEKFSALRAGTPEMDLDLGPVINATQKKRIERFFDQAETDAVPVLARGRIADGVPKGAYFVEPRIYGPVPRGNDLAAKEIFGPVLSVQPFEDEADAVVLANDTEYGLMAAVWSLDGNRALRVSRRIRAGQVYVNAFGAGGGIELPFGGMKKSGHGREKGYAALHDMSTLRTTIFKHG
jgi:aldehyde dehydrogenase (NAD+)